MLGLNCPHLKTVKTVKYTFVLFRLDEIQSENMKLKVENTKLVRKVDTIKNENHNIGVMEQEKDSLKQTVAQMKATIDSLQKTQSKQVWEFVRYSFPTIHNSISRI